MTQNTSTNTIDAVRNVFIKLLETLPAESMELSAAAQNSCYTQLGNTENGDNLDDVRTLAVQKCDFGCSRPSWDQWRFPHASCVPV